MMLDLSAVLKGVHIEMAFSETWRGAVAVSNSVVLVPMFLCAIR